MRHSRFFLLTGPCSGVALLLALAPAWSDAPPNPQGVEVLARGPVHEAYARPVGQEPQAGPVVVRDPPERVDELPPEQKPEGDNVQWAPGYWQWDEERNEFLWISGVWRATPPGRQWVSGQYRRVDGGWRWVSGYWGSAQQRESVPLPPPPASLEVGPTAPPSGEEQVYIPGSWTWVEGRYRWRPGFYAPFRPGWIWVPAHFVWTPTGCLFVDGYWDFPLEERGVLFAPARFTALGVGFTWTPSYCVSVGFLSDCLWVGPRSGHYFFGDYYAAHYGRAGYSFWLDYRFGRSCYDPCYAYYRVAYRDRGWERDLRRLHVARLEGRVVLPPRSLADQVVHLQREGPRAVVALGPIDKLNGPGVRLQQLNLEQRQRVQRDALLRPALAPDRPSGLPRNGERNPAAAAQIVPPGAALPQAPPSGAVRSAPATRPTQPKLPGAAPPRGGPPSLPGAGAPPLPPPSAFPGPPGGRPRR